MLLNVQTSPGEFLDKLTILEIKAERMSDPAKLENVRRELALLRETWGASPLSARDVGALLAELKAVNEALWEIEDRKITPLSAESEYIPLMPTTLPEAQATAVLKLVDKLEQDDDVSKIFHTLA